MNEYIHSKFKASSTYWVLCKILKTKERKSLLLWFLVYRLEHEYVKTL